MTRFGRQQRLFIGLVGLTVVALTGVGEVRLAGQTDVGRFRGQPDFSEGRALGYFVWLQGDTWKVRWTTFGADHRFSGQVTVVGGEVESLKRVDVDVERRVVAPGRPARVVRGPRGRVRGVRRGRPPVVRSRAEDRIEQETERLIRFVTRTDDDIDGFDFTVSNDAQRLRLVLQIDGEPRPAEIEVGRDNFKPQDHPVVVRLR
jgi:hypothetical protein